ncbi:MAG: helix-turn-helix domain-containing protein [Bacteroidales bacterium]|jgi:transcriptional regulator with XRE-family HTH domain|nr:helix-turn-helix domain-containing protein [Bacteroidales bacterium]
MKDRLNKIMVSEGLTATMLADEMGIQRSGISHILSGRNYPSFDFLQKLLARFPRLNAEWIILGIGDMYKPAADRHNTGTPLEDLFTLPETKQTIPSPVLSQATTAKNTPEASPVENENPYPQDMLPPVKTRSKTVEKIVVMYIDKSFSVYLPE